MSATICRSPEVLGLTKIDDLQPIDLLCFLIDINIYIEAFSDFMEIGR